MSIIYGIAWAYIDSDWVLIQENFPLWNIILYYAFVGAITLGWVARLLFWYKERRETKIRLNLIDVVLIPLLIMAISGVTICGILRIINSEIFIIILFVLVVASFFPLKNLME